MDVSRSIVNRRNVVTAVLAMTGASGLVAATSLIAKALGVDSAAASALHPFQVTAGRFCFALLALAIVFAARPQLRPPTTGIHWRWHIMRSLCGWLGVTCMFAAVAVIPLAEATAISFLSPLVTIGLAVLLLGENAEARKWAGAALSVFGALILLQPGTEAFHPGALFALAAAFFLGLEAIFIKRLSDSEPPFRILLINNMIGTTVSLCAAALFWTWPAQTQWILLALLGVVMVSGQALFIQSMKRGQASLVIPVFYTTLVFAALYDFIVFGARPGMAALLGSTLIVSGAIFIALTGPAKQRQAVD